MSTVVVTGTHLPGTMLDISRQYPDGALPYRKQSPGFQPTPYPPPRQTYSPKFSYQSRSASQEISTHKHTRTASSSALPYGSTTSPPSSYYPTQTPPKSALGDPRRSSGGAYPTTAANMSMQRQGTTASSASAPRRSTSSRSSTNSPTSYVALMRKQKATVWCDRSQSLDPRIAAAQRAAKQRATREVHGSNNASSTGRTSTINSGGVVSKIRHGGVPKAPGYTPANLSGAGVPIRLSTNEMLGDDEEEGRSLGDNSMVHGRTGSGHSSTNSANYRSGYPRPAGGTPPSGIDGGSPQGSIPEGSEKPTTSRKEYFDAKRTNDDSTPNDGEESFGDLKEMAGPSAVKRAEQQAKTAEDLRRRGSVDERAMSLNAGVRLFVANPDMEDS